MENKKEPANIISIPTISNDAMFIEIKKKHTMKI